MRRIFNSKLRMNLLLFYVGRIRFIPQLLLLFKVFNIAFLSLLEKFSLVLNRHLLRSKWVHWIGVSHNHKIFSMNKLTSFLKKTMQGIWTTLLNAPDEFIFKTVLQGLHSIVLLCSVQTTIIIIIKVFSNDKITSTYIAIAIQVIR
jgi:hypothetical protein